MLISLAVVDINFRLADERLDKQLQRLLPSGGDHAIAVASSFDAALTAFSLLVQQYQLVVHRSQVPTVIGPLDIN